MEQTSVSWSLRRSTGTALARASLAAAGPLLAACSGAGEGPPAYHALDEGVATDAQVSTPSDAEPPTAPDAVLLTARASHKPAVAEGAPHGSDASGAGDPCDGISRRGQCDGAVAVRCTGASEGLRRLVRIDCGLVGLACRVGPGGSVACTGKRPRKASD